MRPQEALVAPDGRPYGKAPDDYDDDAVVRFVTKYLQLRDANMHPRAADLAARNHAEHLDVIKSARIDRYEDDGVTLPPIQTAADLLEREMAAISFNCEP